MKIFRLRPLTVSEQKELSSHWTFIKICLWGLVIFLPIAYLMSRYGL